MADTYDIVTAGGETIERETASVGFQVKRDGVLYSPTITEQVEIENDGDMSRPTDQCGNTEVHRTGSSGEKITVQGICTANDDRVGNLSMQMLRDVIGTADSILVRGDIIGPSVQRVAVSNRIITDAEDLVSVNTVDTDGFEQAYTFQLQLGEEESSS